MLLVPLIYKPNASYRFFCRCGYHSSNPLDFNRVKQKGTYYDRKRGIQLEREIFMLREELYKLQEEKKKVNNNLIKANQTIYNLINNKNNEMTNHNNINNLYLELKNKEKEINELKLKLYNKSGIKKYVDFNNIIVVHFISSDQKINCGIKCLKTDTFAEVEEQLYRVYEEYSETNYHFISKGKQILRFKTISENNIHDKDKIQLVQFNNY